MPVAKYFSCVWRYSLLPNNIRNKLVSTNYLIHDNFQLKCFVAIDRNPDRSIFRQEFFRQLQLQPHHWEPLAVLEVVSLNQHVARIPTR